MWTTTTHLRSAIIAVVSRGLTSFSSTQECESLQSTQPQLSSKRGTSHALPANIIGQMQDLLSIPLSEFNSLRKILDSKSTACCTFHVTLLVTQMLYRWLDFISLYTLSFEDQQQTSFIFTHRLCYSLHIYINSNKFNLNTLYITLSLYYIKKRSFVFKKKSLAALI